MRYVDILSITAVVLFVAVGAEAAAVGTAFTYQGPLLRC